MDRARIAQHAFLDVLPEDQLDAVAAVASEREFAAGEAVISEGDFGHCLFLIEEGSAEISVDGASVASGRSSEARPRPRAVSAPRSRSTPGRAERSLKVYHWLMRVARVAIFDEPPRLHDDDDRRASTLRELLVSAPGFVAGYHLREEPTGRLIDLTIWESAAALEAGERAVRNRPVSDQRGIRPSRIERWVVDAAF